MTDEDWNNGYAKSLAVFLNGDAISSPDLSGRTVRDDSFLLLFNAHHEDLEFQLPGPRYATSWLREFDTASPYEGDTPPVPASGQVQVEARSMQLFRRQL